MTTLGKSYFFFLTCRTWAQRTKEFSSALSFRKLNSENEINRLCSFPKSFLFPLYYMAWGKKEGVEKNKKEVNSNRPERKKITEIRIFLECHNV